MEVDPHGLRPPTRVRVAPRHLQDDRPPVLGPSRLGTPVSAGPPACTDTPRPDPEAPSAEGPQGSVAVCIQVNKRTTEVAPAPSSRVPSTIRAWTTRPPLRTGDETGLAPETRPSSPVTQRVPWSGVPGERDHSPPGCVRRTSRVLDGGRENVSLSRVRKPPGETAMCINSLPM